MHPYAKRTNPLLLVALSCAFSLWACDASHAPDDGGDGDVPDAGPRCPDDRERCEKPLRCADLRATGQCGEFERCEENEAEGARCLKESCAEGFRWSSLSDRCIPCLTEGCEAEPTCEPGQPGSLNCGAHRLCLEDGDFGECGGCETGYVDVGGRCLELATCGDARCAGDEYCDRSRELGPRCEKRPCDDPATAVGSDGLCSVRCEMRCDVPGATGHYWPFAAKDDRCVCATLPGYFFHRSEESGGGGALYECDADGDGWVREEVRNLLDEDPRDPAIVANARCVIREAHAVKLINEYGQSSLVESCEEGLLQDPSDEGEDACTPRPFRLFESKRNDVEGEAGRLGEAPPSTYGGRRFRAAELNSLTKACVSALGDYDDDGVPDLVQVQPFESAHGDFDELTRLRAFSHFVELHETSWEELVFPGDPSPSPSILPATVSGILRIKERSRCGIFPLGYGQEAEYNPEDGASYWRNCQRRRHPDFGDDPSVPGFDFARFSCDSPSGSCPKPPLPAHPTHPSFPNPAAELLRNHGLCELGAAPPADGFWRGMGHHSQFQCVRIVGEENEGGRQDRSVSDFGESGSLVFNACVIFDCEDAEGCADSTPPWRAPDPFAPLIQCTQDAGLVEEGAVGWAAYRYRPYGHVDTNGAPVGDSEYLGGCINEIAEYPALCPVPEFSRCEEPERDAFGRYPCHGWESLFLWADDTPDANRFELMWAPELGEPMNGSVLNPASEPICT